MNADRIKPFYRALGTRLKALRKAQGMTQEDLARRLRVSRTSVTNIETGNQLLTIHVLFDWAAALGIRAADLIADQELEVRSLEDASAVDRLREFEGLSDSDAEFLRRIRAKAGTNSVADQEEGA